VNYIPDFLKSYKDGPKCTLLIILNESVSWTREWNQLYLYSWINCLFVLWKGSTGSVERAAAKEQVMNKLYWSVSWKIGLQTVY